MKPVGVPSGAEHGEGLGEGRREAAAVVGEADAFALALGRRVAGHRRGPLASRADRVAVFEHAVAVLADQCFPALSEHPCFGRVDGDDRVAGVDKGDSHADVFHQRPVHLLAAAQRLEDLPPLGDVARRSAETAQFAAGVEHRDPVGLQVHQAARLVDVHVVDAAERFSFRDELLEEGLHPAGPLPAA